MYDGLGLTKPGKAHELVDNGDNTYGGKWVINPSGGLLSKGHPLGVCNYRTVIQFSAEHGCLGATGLGMIFYIVRAAAIYTDQAVLIYVCK